MDNFLFNLEPVGIAYSFALNLNIVQLRAGVGARPVCAVGRHQRDGAAIVVYTLEGGLIANAHSGYFAVIHRRLNFDIHHIIVMDTGIDHAVTMAAQAKIAGDVFRHIHHVLHILLSSDRITTGDVANQRALDHFRQRLEPGRNGA